MATVQTANTNKLTSSESFPISTYFPLVQAIRNEVKKVLDNEGGLPFDSLFGAGAREDLANFAHLRFTMDGEDPLGRKVGLLDINQIWCFLADPYSRYLVPQIAIRGGRRNSAGSLSFHAKAMLSFFAPGAEIGEFRETMYQEFLKIRDQEDPYATKYMCKPPDALSYEDARQAEKS
jgi:hypothetical protein